MILDLLLLLLGMLVLVLFAVPRAVRAKEKPLAFLLCALPSYVLASGGFVTVVKLLVLLRVFEDILSSPAQEALQVSVVLLRILVNMRPLLISIMLYLILRPLTKSVLGKIAPNAEAVSPSNRSDSAGVSCNGTCDISLLSRRETEVARLASFGYTNAQIAELLYISVATVKRHLATVFEKLNISSRKELSGLF